MAEDINLKEQTKISNINFKTVIIVVILVSALMDSASFGFFRSLFYAPTIGNFLLMLHRLASWGLILGAGMLVWSAVMIAKDNFSGGLSSVSGGFMKAYKKQRKIDRISGGMKGIDEGINSIGNSLEGQATILQAAQGATIDRDDASARATAESEKNTTGGIE